MPEQDAVVAITSGGRDMQAVMNLVREKLLPALKQAPLPANGPAVEKLNKKLAGLAVRPVTGNATSPLAATVSGKRYVFPDNRRLSSKGKEASLVVRTLSGESKIVCGPGTRRKGRASFVNDVGGSMVALSEPIAASGAWTGDHAFTVKLCLYGTPFYTTMVFRFTGEQLMLDSEHNVAFGPITLPQLVGQAGAGRVKATSILPNLQNHFHFH